MIKENKEKKDFRTRIFQVRRAKNHHYYIDQRYYIN